MKKEIIIKKLSSILNPLSINDAFEHMKINPFRLRKWVIEVVSKFPNQKDVIANSDGLYLGKSNDALYADEIFITKDGIYFKNGRIELSDGFRWNAATIHFRENCIFLMKKIVL